MTRKKEERKDGPTQAVFGPARKRAPFPGGSGVGTESVLRVAIDRTPMADLVAHGGSSPDLEVCGVLIGTVGEDARGEYVHIQAVIRGEQAREQSAHVTFTHETWNHIHTEMDKLYPGLEIVGWYHTHPGFGVFLSDMDQFIHKNFFGQPHQVALVQDPLGGKTALFTLREGILVPLRRYWRDGKTVELDSPLPEDGGPSRETPASETLATLQESVARIERRLDEPARRSWLEDWLTPGLLLAILTILILQVLFAGRERRMASMEAQVFEQLIVAQEAGLITIRDLVGNQIRLLDVLQRPGGVALSAPARPLSPDPTAAPHAAPPQPGRATPRAPGAPAPSQSPARQPGSRSTQEGPGHE